MEENDRRTESDWESRREEGARREPKRDSAGYRGPAYLGYPGHMNYPWSRYLHGMSGILDFRVPLPESGPNAGLSASKLELDGDTDSSS
jgi:hypothetical protein